MGYENCENCKGRVWMGDVDKAYYEYPIICRKCEEKISYNSKPDASKIKKVVIPETEVKYKLEIEENSLSTIESQICQIASEIEDIDDYELDRKGTLVDSIIKRIETPKPLADDEVNVEDYNPDKYYAGLGYSKMDKQHYVRIFDAGDFCPNPYDEDSESPVYDFIINETKNGNILRFDDQETLFQWCLDEARRAKGE